MTLPVAQVVLGPTYEAIGLDALAQPWHWAVAIAAAAVALAFTWWMYRRDSVELRPGYAWWLLSLRWGILVALAIYLARPEKRADRLDVHPSRVAVLVDTSLSMGRTDSDEAAKETSPASKSPRPTRLAQVADKLCGASSLLEQLQSRHEVVVYRFDQPPQAELLATLPLTTLPLASPAPAIAAATETPAEIDGSSDDLWATWRGWARMVPVELWWTLAGVLASSVVCGIVWLVTSRRLAAMTPWQWGFAILGSLVPAVPVVVWMALVVQEHGVVETVDAAADRGPPTDAPAANEPAREWRTTLAGQLVPRGTQTRLGSALSTVLREQRSQPVAGIVLFTDGGHNAGDDPAAVAQEAKAARIPIHAVGLGSDQRLASVRVAEFAAPARVFPEDSFDVTAFVQATNLAERMVSVELHSRLEGQPAEKLDDTQRVKLGGDGVSLPVKFTLKPEGIGRRVYTVRVEALAEDYDPRDNLAQATVEVVQRKLRVLLFAGGPSREYQYVRNLLRRDKTTTLDVLLQIAKPGPGISQDANEILAEFPRTKVALAQYDAVVAFDPDWTELSAEQVDLLEEWVGNHSGGLVVAAGPVHTAAWSSDVQAPAHMNKLRALYPVVFPRRGLALASDAERFRSTIAYPLEFTAAGRSAAFLRVDEVAANNAAAWSQFGAFGYYPVDGTKPGATVLAHYALPEVEPSKRPPYLVSQFYGGGRVLYVGSGELWRMRSVDETYFERLYTRLVRHVAEGRLLRGTQRGALLLDSRRFALGDRVEIKAQLRAADEQPITAESVPLAVTWPDASVKSVPLVPFGGRPGMYRAEFVATQQGNYGLTLETPGLPHEVVAESLRVLEPDLEADHSRRNDPLLRTLAETTGGKYYPGLAAPRPGLAPPDIAGDLRDATRQVRIRGTPSTSFAQHLAQALLATLLGMMFVEWTSRRLGRLA